MPYHAIITATFSDTFDNKDCGMSAQMQRQQPDISQKRKESQKSFPWKLALVLLIFFAALAMLAVWILSILNILPAYWAAILTPF